MHYVFFYYYYYSQLYYNETLKCQAFVSAGFARSNEKFLEDRVLNALRHVHL